jgi:uroporphyrinogen decarboxylase
LIGFAGAPFTLASYLVEGGPSRDHARTKALMHDEPGTWSSLMDALSAVSRSHLLAQVEAGVQAVQLFDSWVGALSPSDYARSVQPWVGRVLEDLAVPSIHFGVGTGELLTLMRDAGGDAIGIDWRVPLDRAWERIGADRAIQGNLDPAVCTGSWEAVERGALEVLERSARRDGYVFNLGHGVLPQTPVENLQRLVDWCTSGRPMSTPDRCARDGLRDRQVPTTWATTRTSADAARRSTSRSFANGTQRSGTASRCSRSPGSRRKVWSESSTSWTTAASAPTSG